MSIGTVKWFDVKKGYGFIIPEDGGKDVFVHITKVHELGQDDLPEGAKIYYEIYSDRERIAAGNLRMLY